MASKTKKMKHPTPPELMAALTEAGYTVERSDKGSALTVHLTPANLTNEKGSFTAVDVCTALQLHAQCRVFTQAVQNLLILTIEWPEPESKPAPTDA